MRNAGGHRDSVLAYEVGAITPRSMGSDMPEKGKVRVQIIMKGSLRERLMGTARGGKEICVFDGPLCN